jgi:8-oxo-dGTP diphosphatase
MKKGVSIIVLNKEREYLIFFHKKLNIWAPPSGKVEPDENIEDAVFRELKEEVGITLKEIKFLFNEIIDLSKYKMGKLDVYTYLVEKYEGDPENMEPDKHENLQWIKKEDLLKLNPITSSLRKALEYL